MNKLYCEDCGIEYGTSDWIDTHLPNTQWLQIHPEGYGGILCANCIIKRMSKANDKYTVAFMIFVE